MFVWFAFVVLDFSFGTSQEIGWKNVSKMTYLFQVRRKILTTTLQPFCGSLDFVQGNLGESVPEETFTHSHLSCSSIIPYLLPPPFMIHGILLFQFTCLTVFFHNLSKFSLVYLLAWHPSLHTPYISSPNHCLLFAANAHTIATCLPVVPRLCHLILISTLTQLIITSTSSVTFYGLNTLPVAQPCESSEGQRLDSYNFAWF